METKEPIFTLTAEEADDFREAIDTHILWIHLTKPKTEFWGKELKKYKGYLTRLTQWQDEKL